MARYWNEILKGLEPETQAAFKDTASTYFDAADIARAVAHSQAVSAAKANAINMALGNTNDDLAAQIRRLIDEIQAIQTYGLRLAR